MTVLGAFLPDHEHAVLWADSETFRWDGSATGRHVRKVAVNNVAGLLGTGGGWGVLVDAGDRIVHQAKSFDGTVQLLPEALRQASAKAVKLARPDPESFASSCYLVAGRSAASGRTLVWRFDAASFFVPTLATFTLAPMVDTTCRPDSERTVLDLARRQMQLLRDDAGQAGAGHLTIATLSPDGIALRLHRDFYTPPAGAPVAQILETAA